MVRHWLELFVKAIQRIIGVRLMLGVDKVGLKCAWKDSRVAQLKTSGITD